jgi:hypothetical protein
MMKQAMWLLALSAYGCDQGAADSSSHSPKTKATSTITLTSVAFAEDCGGTPPPEPPATIAAPERRAPAAAPAKALPPSEPAQDSVDDSGRRRRCDQTAMQLAIESDTATELHIKSVEVIDSYGSSIGTLHASKPTRWNDAKAVYEPWDEKVVAGKTSISYVLSQPVFIDMFESRDRTYTVKVVAALGGVDQPLKTTVLVVGRSPPVPT